jgi:membrane protease YdiL (CAAX protease family)
MTTQGSTHSEAFSGRARGNARRATFQGDGAKVPKMKMPGATPERDFTTNLASESLPTSPLTLRPTPPFVLATLFGNTCSWPQASGYYWQQSRRPLTCLAFVAPLLLLYEGGVLFLGAQAVRNGADVWLRQLLDLLGFGQYFLLPVLTVGILLGWHHAARQPWRIVPGVLYAMFAECLLLALALLVIARLQGAFLSMFLPAQSDWPVAASIISDTLGTAGRLVSFFGAGIYEEVLFRLMLLPLAAWVLRWAGCNSRQALVGAVVLTSLLFSAAHYIGPHGQPLDASTFLFRFVAGAFFAALFVYRGFGIAAGSHAFYDILVGLCLAA